MRLEGRVAGPWASELDRVWVETAPRLTDKQVLRTIYSQTHAAFITNTPWAQFLAEEVTASKATNLEEGD